MHVARARAGLHPSEGTSLSTSGSKACARTHAGAQARARCVARSSREKKDYRMFDSIDAMQAELHKGSDPNSPFTIGGLLNTLSSTAFGAESELRDQQDSLGARGPTLATLPMYISWAIGSGYRNLIRSMGALKRRGKPIDPMDEANLPPVSDEAYEAVEKVLGGLVTKYGLRRMIYRYPPLSDMPPSEIAARLLSIKSRLPGCDVCFLVEDQPKLFLGDPMHVVESKIDASMASLEKGLAGANLTEMIMRDPGILFFNGLDAGLAQLRDLWDVDEEAMANSDPAELAFAVRSLVYNQLPESF